LRLSSVRAPIFTVTASAKWASDWPPLPLMIPRPVYLTPIRSAKALSITVTSAPLSSRASTR
jgi:hypothetical protein